MIESLPGLPMDIIYLDHSAATPVDPEVMAVMMRYFGHHFGNPSSAHSLGREAKQAVEDAREQVANLLEAEPSEIYFTSGGTEADNLALLGAAHSAPVGKNHLITSAIEHPAVLKTCEHLQTRGFEVTYLPVDPQGSVNPRAVLEAVTPRTFLISIMHANNVIGTVEPIGEIGLFARERGILFHTDAVQSVGKIPVRVGDLSVDLLSLSGHKISAPKGTGALYIRRGLFLTPVTFGGGQEMGFRPGTENVPGIAGLGKACEIARRDLVRQMDVLHRLREKLVLGLQALFPGLVIHGHVFRRLPNLLCVSFPPHTGHAVAEVLNERGVALSSGSACHTGKRTVSTVLTALPLSPEVAAGAVRFSLGRGNSEEDIDRVLAMMPDVLDKLILLKDLEEGLGRGGCR